MKTEVRAAMTRRRFSLVFAPSTAILGGGCHSPPLGLAPLLDSVLYVLDDGVLPLNDLVDDCEV
jgi:hypothetical protein